MSLLDEKVSVLTVWALYYTLYSMTFKLQVSFRRHPSFMWCKFNSKLKFDVTPSCLCWTDSFCLVMNSEEVSETENSYWNTSIFSPFSPLYELHIPLLARRRSGAHVCVMCPPKSSPKGGVITVKPYVGVLGLQFRCLLF